jgi:hypothetical protein
MNQTTTNLVALIQTMQSQTKACIATLHEICAVVSYYTALMDNSSPAFQDNLSVPASMVKISRRENRAQGKLTDTVFFLQLYPSSNF